MGLLAFEIMALEFLKKTNHVAVFVAKKESNT